MPRKLWFLFALLTWAGLTFCQSAEAQPIPTWKNDAQGRPAPPCMVLDAATGVSTPCSSSNPLPTGGGAGQGTTTGTSITGFGRQWFPSSVTGSVAGGQHMAAFFDGADGTVIFLRRNTGCANCLQVAVSTDGGVTGTFFSTAAFIGNNVQHAFRVPSTPPRYLVTRTDTAPNSLTFQSASLTSGWTTIAQYTGPAQRRLDALASTPAGSRLLGIDDTGIVCVSTDAGITFGSCVASGGGGGGNTLAYTGGTTWLIHEGVAGNIRRSTNDGASFALVTTFGTNAQGLRCLSPTFTTCVAKNADGNVRQSTDGGLTWTIRLSGIGATAPGICELQANSPAGSGVFGILGTSPPVGFGTIALNAFNSFNAGLAWFTGQTNGSPWDGTGTPTLTGPIDCRNGRGIATYQTTGGGVNIFAVYNPLTSPGGTLTSSAGGYSISVPIQAGIILNALPVTSAANTAAVVTLTNTGGSRICIRTIALFSSAASAVVTLRVTDGATVILNLGTPATAITPSIFSGTPLVCSQTSNNLVVNIGAAGGVITTTTSVIADRYPN